MKVEVLSQYGKSLNGLPEIALKAQERIAMAEIRHDNWRLWPRPEHSPDTDKLLLMPACRDTEPSGELSCPTRGDTMSA
jgi:hypothetical protein